MASMRRCVSARSVQAMSGRPAVAPHGTRASKSRPRISRRLSEVGLPVADSVEHGGDPLAVAQVDRVAGEQQPAFAAVPQVGRRPRRVAGNGDHVEVLVEDVALGEGTAGDAGPGQRLGVGAVEEEGRADPLGGEHGFVVMVEVLPGRHRRGHRPPAAPRRTRAGCPARAGGGTSGHASRERTGGAQGPRRRVRDLGLRGMACGECGHGNHHAASSALEVKGRFVIRCRDGGDAHDRRGRRAQRGGHVGPALLRGARADQPRAHGREPTAAIPAPSCAAWPSSSSPSGSGSRWRRSAASWTSSRAAASPSGGKWPACPPRWRERIDERIAELERLKAGLTDASAAAAVAVAASWPTRATAPTRPGAGRHWIGDARPESAR